MLNIDPWVALPWRFVQTMTAAALSGLAKEEIAHPAEVAETDALRIPLHLSNDFFNGVYIEMVPLLVSLSS